MLELSKTKSELLSDAKGYGRRRLKIKAVSKSRHCEHSEAISKNLIP
jgi:hypothetical protein